MAEFTLNHDRDQTLVATDEIVLSFSHDDGGLRELRRVDGPNLVGHGAARPSVDLQVGVEGVWLGDRTPVRYLRHRVAVRDGAVEAVIITGVGPLMVHDVYRLSGASIHRSVVVENVSEDEIQLRAVRLTLPWVRAGEPGFGRFEAPGNSVRPHVPLLVAAAQRRDVLPRRFFAPGLREGQALEPSPVHGPGLLAVADYPSHETLLCWYESDDQTAQAQVEGNDGAVALSHEIDLAGRLAAGARIAGGVQRCELVRLPWREALARFRAERYPVTATGEPEASEWVSAGSLYEVDPALLGGFRGLAVALDDLRDLGITTLCLLPVWLGEHSQSGPGGNGGGEGGRYAVGDLELLDPALGSPDDLQRLVAAAHARGMRVVVDLPLAGCGPSSRYVAEHREWFCEDAAAPSLVTREGGVLQFDWSNDDLQAYVLGVTLAFAREFDLDGYRAVVARRPATNWSRTLPRYGSAGSLAVYRMLGRLRRELKEQRPDTALLSALGGPASQEVADAVCDELPHHQFFHLAFGRITPAELGDWLDDYTATMRASPLRIGFVESYHTRQLNPLADGLRGSRISRMLLSGMVFAGFVPLITAGQELGDESFIRRLLGARAEHRVLRAGAVHYNAVTASSPDVFGVLRTAGDTCAVGLMNVGAYRRSVAVALPDELVRLGDHVALVDALAGGSLHYGGRRVWRRDDLTGLALTLEPFSAGCLVMRSADAPEAPDHTADLLDGNGVPVGLEPM